MEENNNELGNSIENENAIEENNTLESTFEEDKVEVEESVNESKEDNSIKIPEQKISIGRIVEFFPNNNQGGLRLPNGMQSAPAIVVQIFDQHINLNVFTAETNGSTPVKQAYSVSHKSKAQDGQYYWDWLPRV